MSKCYVVELKNVRKHSNADRLQIGECYGEQVIVDLSITNGTKGVYFPTDTQLSEEFCEKNNLVIKKDEQGNNIGGYLDPKKRHIRALKLRGERSEGLFLPIESMADFTDISKLKVGECFDTIGDKEICCKYVPRKPGSGKTPRQSGQGNPKKKKKSKFPDFKEHVDTKQFAYCKAQFEPGDICYITLKMHGTSGRTGYLKEVQKVKPNLLRRIVRKIAGRSPLITKEEWKYITGTRRVVLSNFDGGYHGSNEFRKGWHDSFKGKLKKGETVYYEIVGFMAPGRPIMGTVDNKKVGDKQFVKQYGKTTTYSYSCEDGTNDIYVYRMTFTGEDGETVEYPQDLIKKRCEQMDVKMVPEFDRFIFTTIEDMEERVEKYLNGADPVGKTHVREGVVIRIEGREKFKVFKHKSFEFKVLEGIIKDAGVVDMEEEEAAKLDE